MRWFLGGPLSWLLFLRNLKFPKSLLHGLRAHPFPLPFLILIDEEFLLKCKLLDYLILAHLRKVNMINSKLWLVLVIRKYVFLRRLLLNVHRPICGHRAPIIV
jgi:hypothetical protein